MPILSGAAASPPLDGWISGMFFHPDPGSQRGTLWNGPVHCVAQGLSRVEPRLSPWEPSSLEGVHGLMQVDQGVKHGRFSVAVVRCRGGRGRSSAKEPRQKEQPYSPEPRVGRRWKPVLQKLRSTALVFISFLKASMDLLAIKPKRTLAHAVARNPRLPGGG